MKEEKPCNGKILKLLEERSSTKQKVFRTTKEVFALLKEEVAEVAGSLDNEYCQIDDSVEISFKDKNAYEAEIVFGGDVLIFNMHTNVFTFEKGHSLWNTGYIAKDRRRAYFGMINIYNFLADSFRYNRLNDVGVLLGRIFINHEGHFFVEGRRQLSFLYNDVVNQTIEAKKLRHIVETAIIYAIEYDLTVPDLKDSMVTSVGQALKYSNELIPMTSKKLGFRFHTGMEIGE